MRLFIGIAPDEGARRALWRSVQQLRRIAPGRYVDPSLYHITLAFLGQTESSAIAQVHARMREVAACAKPFALTLGNVGAFGPVLWRGVDDSPALTALSAALRARLRGGGIAFAQGAFVPHFTLARSVTHAPPPDAQPLPQASFFVSSMILYESTRAQGRPAYVTHLEVPF